MSKGREYSNGADFMNVYGNSKPDWLRLNAVVPRPFGISYGLKQSADIISKMVKVSKALSQA